MKLFEKTIREGYNSSGAVKKITRTINNVIVKEFHDHIVPGDFYKQEKKILKMKNILGEYMPETRLVGDTQGYKVIQRKVEGEILAMVDQSRISIETLQHISSLIEKYKQYCITEGEFFDIIGTPSIKYNNIYIKQFYNLTNPKSFRASTNIIIEEKSGRPYRIDIVNGEIENHQQRRGIIREFIRSIFIKIMYTYQKKKLDILLKKYTK